MSTHGADDPAGPYEKPSTAADERFPPTGAGQLPDTRHGGAHAASTGGEGCLTVAIRIPVRIVVLVLVVPVRMVWDLFVAGGRLVRDHVLRPAGRALSWVGRTLVVVPLRWLGRTLVVIPLTWLYARVLTPFGHGLGWLGRGIGMLLGKAASGVAVAVVWLAKAVFVWPWVGLWRYVVVPLGRGLGWLGRTLIVVPLTWLYRSLLTPLGHGTVRLLRALGQGLSWLGRTLVVIPLGWLYARVLTPLGHAIRLLGLGLAAAVVWLAKAVFVWPWVGLWRYLLVPVGAALAVAGAWLWQRVLAPVGRAIGWAVTGLVRGIGTLLRWIFVLPFVALWRWVLRPVGRALLVVAREIGAAFGHAWRVAGHISRAVGRFLWRVLRLVFVEPVRWVYRSVLTPVGHVVRDAVWRPTARAARQVAGGVREAWATARQSARQARAEVRRMLFGDRAEPSPPPMEQPASIPLHEQRVTSPFLSGAENGYGDPRPGPGPGPEPEAVRLHKR
ncbi:hypothetical protein HUT18_08575 [Streptomyces sp. NA04227]|uniref:hypothetical protein n=1 Tax=Streptomyces sp. NA04227 TaxID=2742136 RepID=UPI0015924008|nr:hypothetical protein [Streptomyces sp. NA04227]QKW06448.1 hypothetical protein HUT18_08575 [Streptomyces sp. NA04227]